MSAATVAHPSPASLREYGLGLLREPERSAVEAHVGQCTTCCEALASVDADTLVELAREAAATPAPLETPCHPDLPAELADHPRYRILHALGEGGMGTVFKAEHKVMGRVVALKVINRRLTSKSDVVERFRTEVKAAAKLSHPNIVTAHDAEEANGLHFLVMEFVEGMSLDRYVGRRGPLPVSLACQFMRQAALGLQHAHEKGLVHRDIKPQNLMITRKGQLKILDFGLARLAQHAGAQNATAPNLVLGTPDFLAPEQARNSHAVDIRADLYALGCTFYYLLTRRTPFPGDNVFEKMVAHTIIEVEPITTYRSDVPAEVEAIVYKLLAKKPEDRYATPAELANALAAATKPSAPAPPPALVAPAPIYDPVATTAVMPREEPAEVPRRSRRRRKKHGVSQWPMIVAIAAPVLLICGLLAAVLYSRYKKTGGDDLRASTQPTTGAQPSFSATGKPSSGRPALPARTPTNRLLIIAPQRGLWWKDYAPLKSTLQNKGRFEVVVASTSLAPFELHRTSTSEEAGWTDKADRTIDQGLNADEYDAVIFVGFEVGPFLPSGQYGPPLKNFMLEMLQRNKVVAAICVGVKVLALHGILNNQAAAEPDLLHQFADECPQSIRWDSKSRVLNLNGIITAAADRDYQQFAGAIHNAIKGKR